MKEIFFSQIEVGHHAVFAYLIGDLDTGEAAIVDPADNVDDLIALSRQYKLDIQTIINTHGHVDHIMGNAEMKEKTNASIAIHVDEAEYLSKIGRFWLDMFNARKSPPADILLQDGDVVSVGRFDWKVLHTPGHTPGGICLYNVEYGYCLTGDTLFVGSVGRIDGPKASGSQMLEAIRSKLLSLPDETNIFPGHNYGYKEASTIAEERSSNPFINGNMTSMIL